MTRVSHPIAPPEALRLGPRSNSSLPLRFLSGVLAKALLVLTLAFASSGCFIVTDPVFLDALPNRPPRIVEESVQPARQVTVPALPGCSVTFRAQAEDPDALDTLIARWYIDYDAENNPAPFAESELAYVDALPNTPRLRIPAALTLRLDAVNNPLPLGDHAVEVLVTDGTLINRDPVPRPPIGTFADGGPISDRSYVVSYAWFVHVTDEGSSCP